MGNFFLDTQYEENVKKKYLMSYMLPDSVRNHKGSDPDTYFSDWSDPDPFFSRFGSGSETPPQSTVNNNYCFQYIYLSVEYFNYA